MKRKFTVDESEAGMRLDLFLADKNNDLTRSFIKTQISDDNVLVNGDVMFKANYRVKDSDEIQLQFEKESPPEIIPQDIELDIVYEDDDLVVINKPSGMVVHPATGNFRNTLVNALVYRYKNIKNVGERVRSGLIHRLDKDTSGLILVAKTNKALWYYSKQFAERNVKKYYLAVVKADILPLELAGNQRYELQNYMGRNPKDRQKFSVVQNGGKHAHTVFSHLLSKGKHHLILADLRTGRTHQIRVHLSSLGIPVCGDKIYGKLDCSRLMLHSWRIEITALGSTNKVIQAPVPKEFFDLFSNLDEVLTDTKIN